MSDPNRVDTADLEKEILFEALQRSDPARAAYVEAACGADAALAARVRKLLEAHARAGAFLATPTAGAASGGARGARGAGGAGGAGAGDAGDAGDAGSGAEATNGAAPDAGEGPGSRLGPYRLVAVLGEGGFGKVFLAMQEEPVVRPVAIKVVRPGMDSRQVMARFDAERQALALMTHPGIAQIFDAGATDAGRPFFVMEYVEGEPLTTYCDRRSLPVRTRVGIFEKVCLAVHHAHQKGVIHRDLKPTNVLVTEHDGEPVPKVIDFGIAKAIEQPLSGAMLETAALQVLGTPQYMSPEQARVGASDIDTRADVYALGALLYELLVGAPPLDAGKLRDADIAQVQRLIREETPPRPSARIGMLPPEDADRVADERDADYTELRSALRGDLDWITLKALEKDRRRRYDSAAAFAHDLRRHLADEPVGARPPSAIYILGKFVRRHQVAATSGIAVAAALLIGLVLAVVGLQRASEQADVAERALGTAQIRLWDSLLAQARAGRESDRPGRRFDSLAALREAGRIRIAPELRDEAIACLTLADVQRRLTLTGVRVPSVKGMRVIDRIAYATIEGETRVEALPGRATIAELSDGDFTPVGFTFSPGGRYLAVMSIRGDHRAFRVWDLERGVAIIELPHDRFGPNGVAFDEGAPTARWVAICETDAAVHVYRLPDATPWRRIPVPAGEIRLAGGPAGRRLAITGAGPDLAIHDLEADAELIRVTLDAPPRSLAWSRDGVLAIGAADASVHLYREDGALIATMSGHQAHVVDADFSADGSLLATYGWDNTVRLWDVNAGAPFLGPMRGAWLGGFGDMLATHAQGEAVLWSIERGVAYRHGRSEDLFGSPARLAFSPDGRRLATSGENGLLLWDAATLTLRGTVTVEPARSVDFHPDGTTLVGTTLNGLYRWRIVETDDGPVARDETCLARLRLVRASAPGPGWRTIWVVDRDGAHEVDVEHGGILRTLPAYAGIATRPAASPDGRWLFTGTWKGEPAAVWDLQTREPVQRFAAAHVIGAFSPDGRWLVVGTGAVFRFLEVGTWRVARELARDNVDDLAGAIRFSEDGSLVALGHSRFVIRLLDPQTGAVLAALENPDGLASTSYAFSGNAGTLAATTPQKSLLAWDLRAIRAELASLGMDWQ